jgi:hypothetical protein
MTADIPPGELPELPEPEPAPQAPARVKRDPASTLTTAMLVYIFVTLLLALPIVIVPGAFFDAIGLESAVADQMNGLRWVGAVLLAWAVSGILVLARPEGRAIFVTAGALQMTFAALSLLYSWSVSEYEWATWYQVLITLVVLGASVFLWWARLTGRKVLSGSPAKKKS